jgi:hypothetical protein
MYIKELYFWSICLNGYAIVILAYIKCWISQFLSKGLKKNFQNLFITEYLLILNLFEAMPIIHFLFIDDFSILPYKFEFPRVLAPPPIFPILTIRGKNYDLCSI